MDIKSQLRQFIRTTFLRGEEADLSDEASLIRSGLLDSTDQLELVLFLESDFGITLGEDEAGVEHLDSLERIEALVTRKLAETPSSRDVGDGVPDRA